MDIRNSKVNRSLTSFLLLAEISAGWRLSRWLRVIGECAAERYFEPRSAPSLDRQGPYVTLGVRLQVAWPE